MSPISVTFCLKEFCWIMKLIGCKIVNLTLNKFPMENFSISSLRVCVLLVKYTPVVIATEVWCGQKKSLSDQWYFIYTKWYFFSGNRHCLYIIGTLKTCPKSLLKMSYQCLTYHNHPEFYENYKGLNIQSRFLRMKPRGIIF